MSIVHDHDGDKPKDSEHKHDNSNHDETSEFLDNSDTIEFEDDITTTISPEKETTTDLGKTVETRLIARRHFIVKYWVTCWLLVQESFSYSVERTNLVVYNIGFLQY